MNSPASGDDPWDVVIAGAGPTGLTLANHLGLLGIRTLVLEKLPGLIDYPRGVGIDDESLRTFQAAGLVDAVRQHTVPNQILSFIDKRGRTLAAMSPSAQPFGWPRRSGFIQPRVDRVLAEGLKRFDGVAIRFKTTVHDFRETTTGVEIDVSTEEGAGPQRISTIDARYLVGCDGGRSLVRGKLGLPFDGQSESTKWLVIDLADDPLGTPNAAFVLDDELPHVTMGLPHGIRRFEFMVPADADEATYDSERTVAELLARVLPKGVAPHVIRHRVYTHHARIAPSFRQGRVMIAGDAAHVMPVWQGQGFNTGIRDAFNLGWKLALAVKQRCGDGLLDSYTVERHPHALAMIDLSVLTGKIFVPANGALRMLRNVAGPMIAKIGPLRRYISEMRFKPMPFFKRGIVLHSGVPHQNGAVGKMFIQPRVSVAGRSPQLLDDLIGLRFAILGWSVDIDRWIDADARNVADAFDARCIKVVPACQMVDASEDRDAATLVVADHEGKVKQWFDTQRGSLVVLRPDRVVAAICQPWQLSADLKAIGALLELQPQMSSAESIGVATSVEERGVIA